MDERLELLMTRKLDGRITPEEELELNRGLIRSPEARAAFEDYARIDALAAEALRTTVRPERHIAMPVAMPHRARFSRLAIRIGGALAACVALVVATMSGLRGAPEPTTPAAVSIASNPEPAVAARPVVAAAIDDMVEGPRRVEQQLSKNVLAIWDEETESLYVLELNDQNRRIEPLTMSY